MAGIIRVQPSVLVEKANRMEQLADQFNSQWQALCTAMDSELKQAWQGPDAIEYEQRFNSVAGLPKVTLMHEKAMRTEADLLRYAADKYEKTQQDALTRAAALPK